MKKSAVDKAIEELTRQRDEVRVYSEHKIDGLNAAIGVLVQQQHRKVPAHADGRPARKASKPVEVQKEKAS